MFSFIFSSSNYIGCGPNQGSDALCNIIKTRGYCKQPTAQINCAATCLCGKIFINEYIYFYLFNMFFLVQIDSEADLER